LAYYVRASENITTFKHLASPLNCSTISRGVSFRPLRSDQFLSSSTAPVRQYDRGPLKLLRSERPLFAKIYVAPSIWARHFWSYGGVSREVLVTRFLIGRSYGKCRWSSLNFHTPAWCDFPGLVSNTRLVDLPCHLDDGPKGSMSELPSVQAPRTKNVGVF
jgi:hypothetical protein